MLILNRKLGEVVVIGDDIKITFMSGKGKQVKIGIDAPKEVKVVREEIVSQDDEYLPNHRE